jgi:large conductance mechanosensitive channel
VWNEFKTFAIKGNVIDLAVAVIIGAAFGKIVSSLVNDVVMPIIGVILGGLDFSKLVWTIGKAQIKYGMFFQSIVDFLIISVSIFFMVRVIQHFKKKEEPKVEVISDKQEELLTEIRDLLRHQTNKGL